MGQGSVRGGAPTSPTMVSSGADGNLTNPRVFTFDPYARPVILFNKTGGSKVILVKINATDDTDFGGSSDDGTGHFPIKDGESAEISLGGILNIHRVSFVTTDGADDLDKVNLTGWRP